MKFPKILKSKRGVAIENAILFMILLFSLCALLTTLTLLGNYRLKLENNALIRDVEIDQIGEDYIFSLKNGNGGIATFLNDYASHETYTCEADEGTLTVWRKTDENKAMAVLYVEAEVAADGKVNVTCWEYDKPTSASE